MSGLDRLNEIGVLLTPTSVVASYNAQINISRIKAQAFVAKWEKEVTEILKRQKALISKCQDLIPITSEVLNTYLYCSSDYASA